MITNAVKVRIGFKSPGNSSQNDSLTAEAVERHNLGEDSCRVIQMLIKKHYMAGYRAVIGHARKMHKQLTLPWDEDERLLMLTVKPQYDGTIGGLRTMFWEQVDGFIAVYPEAVEDARNTHKDTFDPENYPAQSELRELFEFQTRCEPIPASSHFINVLNGEALQQAQAEMEVRNQERVAEAVTEVWRRFIEPVRALAERLADPGRVVREELVENVRQMVATIPAFNLTGSPELITATGLIATALEGVSASTIKDSPVLRLETATAAAAVLGRFGSLGVRKFAA